MALDQMIFDQMTLDQITFDQMTLDQITFDQMTLDQMTFGQMTVCYFLSSVWTVLNPETNDISYKWYGWFNKNVKTL